MALKINRFFNIAIIFLCFSQNLFANAQHQSSAQTLPLQAPDYVAIKSGVWKDPATWADGKLPTANSYVLVPSNITVTVASIVKTPLDFLLVEGGLTFNSQSNTKLLLGTLWITSEAKLDIGTSVEHIGKAFSAEVIFFRPTTQQDDKDLRGGLVSMGEVNINGAPKSSYASTQNSLNKGLTKLSFSSDTNWNVGDRLIFPAVELNQNDELRNIVKIQNNGQQVWLDKPLENDHILPRSLNTRVPVGNMSRNVRFSTHESVPNKHRAHIMFMHRQTGVNINHASFERLGRTDTQLTHTKIVRDRNGDIPLASTINTIGRYSVHFHIQQGARKEVAPHTIKNSVISECLKHAVVNHGGHVIASQNVTYNCAGSHFFAENGSEIGKFEKNLAIRSKGSKDSFISREANSDFGHGGHGFWMQGGGGIEVSGNYAFGHSDSAYFYFGQYMIENGEPVYFRKKNAPILDAYNLEYPLHSRDVPIEFSNNVAVSSTRGLDIWNNKEYATHDIATKVIDSVFYSNKLTAIFIPYSKNIEIDNVLVIGGDDFPGIGINTNTKTSDLVIRNSSIAGYTVGIELPRHGDTVIDSLTLNNKINFMLRSPLSRDRSFTFRNLDLINTSFFEKVMNKLDIDWLLMASKKYPTQYDFFMQGVLPTERGDISMVFEPTKVLIESGENAYVRKQLYFPEQASDFVPFEILEVAEIEGKTNQDLWAEFKLAVGGVLLPASAQRHEKIHGYIGSAATYLEKIPAKYFDIEPTVYKGNYVKDYSGSKYSDGWNFISIDVGGNARTVLLHADKTPPTFEIDPRVSLKIHPDDVQFGLRLEGDVIDYVAGIKTVNRVNREYRQLVVNDGGYIDVVYPITDAAGNINNVKYSIQVTDSVPARGQDLAKHVKP